MKREFLEELGLDRPIIDSIMSEHGRSVSALKEKCKEAEEKDGVIASLTAERDGLAASLSAESERHAAFKGSVIDGIVKDARPTSLLAERELRRALSECEGENIRAELERIMASDPDAFKRDKVDAPIFSAFNTEGSASTSVKYRAVR